jgi:transposase
MKPAEKLILECEVDGKYVLADKGYDSNALVESITTHGGKPVIPWRSNRKTPRVCDWHIYRERHLVECFFNKIKHFRRVATRYEKKTINFMAFILLSSILIWLR